MEEKERGCMKKLITAVLAFSLAGMLFTGCSESEKNQPADTQDTVPQETVAEGGKIKLKVWSEASNFDTLNKMTPLYKFFDKKCRMRYLGV